MFPAKKRFQSLSSLILAVSLVAVGTLPAHAQDTKAGAKKAAKHSELHYLSPQKPDVITLLAPPPIAGSAEQSADMAETVAIHEQPRPAGDAAAKAEQKLSIFAFTPVIGSIFQPGKLPETEAFLKKVQEDTEAVEDTGKEYFKRPRPYTVNPDLARGATDLEKTFSYPSGHSTRGTVFALVLVELFPEKRDAILAVGREIGWHRVEIARHYPTDIYAGRVLAQAIVKELKTNDKFRSDFVAAQKEIASVMTAEKQTSEPAMATAH